MNIKRNIADLTNATAYDRDGEKLGSVKEVYINDPTGQPDFVEVSHGLFGMSSSIVPLRGHRLDGEDLRLAFPKDLIKEAPGISDDAHLSQEDHATIYRHFGLHDAADTETYERPSLTDDHDPARDAGASADRLRAESDHQLGLDRTPEERAARGTSTHGMSDEQRSDI